MYPTLPSTHQVLEFIKYEYEKYINHEQNLTLWPAAVGNIARAKFEDLEISFTTSFKII